MNTHPTSSGVQSGISGWEEAPQKMAPKSSITPRQVLSDLIRGASFGSLLIGGTLYPVDELIDPPQWIVAVARVTVGETWIGFPLLKDWIFLAAMLALGWIHRSRLVIQFLVQVMCIGFGTHSAIFVIGKLLIPSRFTQGDTHELALICFGICVGFSVIWVSIRVLSERLRRCKEIRS